MQIPPISVLKGWPAPNYVDPVTRGKGNIILNIVLYTVVNIFLTLRIFTRTRLAGTFGADDIFILIAWIPTTVFFIISVLADAHFLWIRHQYDIPSDHIVTGLKMVLSAEIMFACACTLTKLSMLMLVRRMLVNASVFWRRITLFAIVVVTIQGSVFCLTVIFQCRPPQDYWAITWDPQPNCINQGSSLLIAGIINTLTDFAVVLLPIRTVWTLQVPFQQIVVVVLLFGLGFTSCLAGVVRTYFMYEVTQVWDMTWASYPVWVSSACELYIGVIATAIPACKPFFATYLPQFFGTITTTNRSKTNRTSNSHFSRTGQSNVTISSRGEELLTFEKALAYHGGFSTKASKVSLGPSERSSGEEDCIRITQTVEMVSDKERISVVHSPV